MSVLGWVILIIGALVLGIAAQYLVKTDNLPYRWVPTSIAAFLGAVAASEWLFIDATPEVEGIAVWPALFGALIVGGIVDLVGIWYARTRMHGGQSHGAPAH